VRWRTVTRRPVRSGPNTTVPVRRRLGPSTPAAPRPRKLLNRRHGQLAWWRPGLGTARADSPPPRLDPRSGHVTAWSQTASVDRLNDLDFAGRPEPASRSRSPALSGLGNRTGSTTSPVDQPSQPEPTAPRTSTATGPRPRTSRRNFFHPRFIGPGRLPPTANGRRAGPPGWGPAPVTCTPSTCGPGASRGRTPSRAPHYAATDKHAISVLTWRSSAAPTFPPCGPLPAVSRRSRLLWSTPHEGLPVSGWRRVCGPANRGCMPVAGIRLKPGTGYARRTIGVYGSRSTARAFSAFRFPSRPPLPRTPRRRFRRDPRVRGCARVRLEFHPSAAPPAGSRPTGPTPRDR